MSTEWAADTVVIGETERGFSEELAMPGVVSIVDMAGNEMAEYYHPSLDTISQPGVEMAHVSVEILFDLIAGETANRHVVFESMLVKRGSSRKVT